MSNPSSDESAAAVSFEETLARLEVVVRELEDGQLGLADSLARYEEGIRCLKQCYQALDQAQRKIEILAGVDAQGQPVLEPLDEAPQSLDEKAESRSKRRSRPARKSDGEGTQEGRSTATPDGPDDIMDRGRNLF